MTRFLDSSPSFQKPNGASLLNSSSLVIHLNIKTGMDCSPGGAIFLNLRDIGGKSKHYRCVHMRDRAGPVTEISVTRIKHDFLIRTV